MADLTGAYQLRELAIASARKLEATQILSALLADQASFLSALGQQRSGLIRLREAIDLHQVFLDAIPRIRTDEVGKDRKTPGVLQVLGRLITRDHRVEENLGLGGFGSIIPHNHSCFSGRGGIRQWL